MIGDNFYGSSNFYPQNKTMYNPWSIDIYPQNNAIYNPWSKDIIYTSVSNNSEYDEYIQNAEDILYRPSLDNIEKTVEYKTLSDGSRLKILMRWIKNAQGSKILISVHISLFKDGIIYRYSVDVDSMSITDNMFTLAAIAGMADMSVKPNIIIDDDDEDSPNIGQIMIV